MTVVGFMETAGDEELNRVADESMGILLANPGVADVSE